MGAMMSLLVLLSLAGAGLSPAALGTTLDAERGSLWVLLGVAIVNVVLGVWRPHIGRLWPSS
jgi:hypothetical protein